VCNAIFKRTIPLRAVHDAAKPDAREDDGDLTPANQQR
jgi:hypothetical protein